MRSAAERNASAGEPRPRLARREFLRRAVAGAGAAATFGLAAVSAPAPRRPAPAIDTHVHFYDPTRPEGVPWPPKSNETLYKTRLPKDFRETAKCLNIAGVVVVEASAWLQDNQWILDLAKDDPLIVGFVGHLDPAQPGFSANLKHLAANPLFRGVRFDEAMLAACLRQPGFEAILKSLAEQNLSLDVVGGATMLPLVARAAKLAPDLRVMIDHLPFREWDADPAAMSVSLQEVAQLPRVCAKVSDVVRRADGHLMSDPAFYFPVLDRLRDLFGPERLIYGSNWPVSDLVAPYSVVHEVVAAYFERRPVAEADGFFWKNSLSAYRWQPRGDAAKLLAK
jgi:predicted TIM-barrel fold metal-dependent hydrolase